MKRFRELLTSHEDWLIDKSCRLASESGCEEYPSASEEIRRASINDLSASFLDVLQSQEGTRVVKRNSSPIRDHVAHVSSRELQRCKDLGVSLDRSLGLMKCYRQSFMDLIDQASFDPDHAKWCKTSLDRFFDCLEISLCAQWTKDVTAEHVDTMRALGGWLEGTLSSVADAVIATDAEGVVAFINPMAEKLTGWPATEALGKRIGEVFRVDDELTGEEVENPVVRALREGGMGRRANPVLLTGRSGRQILVEDSCTPVRSEEGVLRGAVFAFRDVSVLRKADEERKAMIRLLGLINSSSDTREMLRTLTLFMRSWSGCQAVAVRLRDRDDFTYAETRGFSEDFVLQENSLCLKDADGNIVRDGTGNPVLECMCGNVIRGSYDPSKPFFTEHGSFWTNSTTDLLSRTCEADRMARTRNRCNGEGYESVALLPLSAAGETYGLLQFNDRRKDRFTPQLISFLETMADNTAIALAQKRAEEERLRLVTAVEQAAECFVLADRNRIIRYVNPAFECLSGYARDEVLNGGPDFLKSYPPNDIFDQTIWKTVAEGKDWTGRIINRKKDGTPYETETTISPVLDVLGSIRDYVIIQRDVSKEAKLEKQLRQALKMEAIGTLAGGIAHDFNNILAPIMGYTEMVLDEIPEDSPLRRDLMQVQKATYRAKELVKQILTFSRQTGKEKNPVRVSLLIDEALKLLRASLPSTIEIRQRISRETSLSTVMSNPTQIHQLLMNLCTNAAHAMREKGGVLEVSLVRKDLDPESIRRYPDLKPGPYQQLSVSDTGHGMDEPVKQRIFDPYFTTKAPGEGTGMGLSVVYGIVKELGGTISVYSEPGKGSVFNVFLPLSEASDTPGAEASIPPPRGHGCILIVDDEAVIAEMVKNMLSRLGYEVVAKSNSEEALETFRAQPERFDVVITDLTMPKLTGLELSKRILAVRPDLPVILCTGFSEIVTPEKAKETGIKEFLMKPLVMRDIAGAIQRATTK